MTRTALIDGDIIAYKSAILVAKSGGNSDDLNELVLGMLDYWERQAKCDKSIATLSGPSAQGFRREIHPDYKANRKAVDRPEDLVMAREMIREAVLTIQRPHIEADDLLGIMLTNGKIENPVCVTIDKDLRQIPGWHCNPDKEDFPVHVAIDVGMRAFCVQWLTGDSTDNYCGIPGIGDKKANKILDQYGSPEHHLRVAQEYWELVIEEEKATKEDMLIQGRLAWILNANDWDDKTGKITLFKPERAIDDVQLP